MFDIGGQQQLKIGRNTIYGTEGRGSESLRTHEGVGDHRAAPELLVMPCGELDGEPRPALLTACIFSRSSHSPSTTGAVADAIRALAPRPHPQLSRGHQGLLALRVWG